MATGIHWKAAGILAMALHLVTAVAFAAGSAEAAQMDLMGRVASQVRDGAWTARGADVWVARLERFDAPPLGDAAVLPRRVYVEARGMKPTYLVQQTGSNARGSVHYYCTEQRVWDAARAAWGGWQSCARPVYSVYMQFIGSEWATQGATVMPGGAWARPAAPSAQEIPPG